MLIARTHTTRAGDVVHILSEAWAWRTIQGRFKTATAANTSLNLAALALRSDYRAPYLPLAALVRKGYVVPPKKKLARQK